MAAPIFDHTYSKISEITFNFPNLQQHAENHFIPSTHPRDLVNFRVP